MSVVRLWILGLCLVLLSIEATSLEAQAGPTAHFDFDGTMENGVGLSVMGTAGGDLSFEAGLEGEALALHPGVSSPFLALDLANLPLGSGQDFSIQFWMRTVVGSDQQFVALSQKDFVDNSLASQKNKGWAFYTSGGTWAWTMGSGERRITYERDNGKHMPLNDGRWHQLTMTYSSGQSEVRLSYDGENRVVYHVSDANGFDFTNTEPLLIGWDQESSGSGSEILPAILRGAEELQDLVDTFNGLGAGAVTSDEFLPLVVDPRRLFDEKVNEMAARKGADSVSFREAMAGVDWEPLAELESALMANPYTVHQNLNFVGTAPLSRIFGLVDGEVTIHVDGAETSAKRERLSAPDFDMDNLAIWDRVLSADEIRGSYAEFNKPVPVELEESLGSLTAASWNIWHGGKHFTVDEHGWDSRVAIAEILKRENVDVLMMQETYSAGDFIAAELGYYFATTVDWDYLNQGANISVLSRYPIKEVYVDEASPFMNVGVKVAISDTQDVYVMSNWYGMDQFPSVFDFHTPRFQESDLIPTFFAGDFNAVPHTDGGDSPASRRLLDAGFTDAFRSLNPDLEAFPGFSHRSGSRIDQLYYKGAGLRNTSTRIISTWPSGFPSDHYLILSTFDLDYSTRVGGR
jgi:exonuclease III